MEDLAEDTMLSGAECYGSLPRVFLADETFPLSFELTKPFPASWEQKDLQLQAFKSKVDSRGHVWVWRKS